MSKRTITADINCGEKLCDRCQCLAEGDNRGEWCQLFSKFVKVKNGDYDQIVRLEECIKSEFYCKNQP